jgi:flavin reductase (DIM6/NTAB) family NADH-FMN oxidoreductase RutF
VRRSSRWHRLMRFVAQDLDAEAAYKLLVGIVVPRPIAWVTTLSVAGRVNAAPFSTFTYVSTKPPMVAISVGRKAGELKDTARNILQRGEFAINIADQTLLEPLHFSSREYSEDVSETEELGIETVPSHVIATPRIAAAPISLECQLHQALEFGDVRSKFIVGEVKLFHIRDELYDNGKIDTAKLAPIARLGGPKYAYLGEIVTMTPIELTKRMVAPAPASEGILDSPI